MPGSRVKGQIFRVWVVTLVGPEDNLENTMARIEFQFPEVNRKFA